MNRLKFLHTVFGACTVPLAYRLEAQKIRKSRNESLLLTKHPKSGESLPRIGLGTYKNFDVKNAPEKISELSLILERFDRLGGRLIDSSPMYGESEEVVGAISVNTQTNSRLFMATKVWTNGEVQGVDQMKESLRKFRREAIELMQIHNLVDWQVQIKTLRKWKELGKIKYIGITHYTPSAFREMEKIIRKEPIDFLQIPYSIAENSADTSLLGLCVERNVAVIANEPFDAGNLFRITKNKILPEKANEYGISSWAQYFLIYILSNPNVHFVIPATSKLDHLEDNMATNSIPLLNEKQRQELKKWLASF